MFESSEKTKQSSKYSVLDGTSFYQYFNLASEFSDICC